MGEAPGAARAAGESEGSLLAYLRLYSQPFPLQNVEDDVESGAGRCGNERIQICTMAAARRPYNSLTEQLSGEMTMNAILSRSVRVALGAAALSIGAGLVLAGTAMAQEHREPHRFEPYRTPHMVFDDRYHHGHYYPALGYS